MNTKDSECCEKCYEICDDGDGMPHEPHPSCKNRSGCPCHTKDSETPNFGDTLESIKHIGDENGCFPDCPSKTHTRSETPKSEWEEEFRKTFAIKATPNSAEDHVKALLLEKHWQYGLITDMVDFIRNLLQQQTERDIERMTKLEDAAEMLWVVLANVSEGDWTRQTQEWQEAAARWRDNYFDYISYKKDQLTK